MYLPQSDANIQTEEKTSSIYILISATQTFYNMRIPFYNLFKILTSEFSFGQDVLKTGVP